MFGLTLSALIVAVVVNVAMFVIAYNKQTDKLTDISYAVTFVILAVFSTLSSSRYAMHVVIMGMVLVWAARLGGFLLYRVSKTGRDTRFDAIRTKFWAFFKFWFFQAVTVWVLLIPVYAFADVTPSMTILTWLGMVVWVCGLLVEAIADYQKFTFTQTRHGWIDTGLWRYSRHPNYFGEILVWAGLYLTVVSSLTLPTAVVALLSPLYIAGMLLFVSGIPILEKSADAKWGKDKKYREYKKSTSILVPLPKRR